MQIGIRVAKGCLSSPGTYSADYSFLSLITGMKIQCFSLALVAAALPGFPTLSITRMNIDIYSNLFIHTE
jgi:hypothetical protein